MQESNSIQKVNNGIFWACAWLIREQVGRLAMRAFAANPTRTGARMGSIRSCMDRQQSKKDTPVSVLFALLVTRTGIEPMFQP